MSQDYLAGLSSVMPDEDAVDVDFNIVLGASIGTTAESSTTEINWPKVIFSILICIIGLIGNTVVIFVIVVLREYRKSVTHWYVLQLAVADSLFLLTLPFKTTEDLNKRWIYPEWMCQAKETLLFLNYYASIMFLMIMSIDRYVAVCHTFSDGLQKLRKPLAAVSITTAAWIICLCLCIPVMLYSATVGTHPYCSCSYVFPSPEDESNITKTCIDQGFTHDIDQCLEILAPTEGGTKYCKVTPDIVKDLVMQYLSGANGGIDFSKYLLGFGGGGTGGGTGGGDGGLGGFDPSILLGNSSAPVMPNISSFGIVPESNTGATAAVNVTTTTSSPAPALPALPGFPSLAGFDFASYFAGAFPAAGGSNLPTEASGEVPNNEGINETVNEATQAAVVVTTPHMESKAPVKEGVPSKCTYVHSPYGWKVFMIFNFVVMYVLPVIVMVVCYGLIINRLSSSKFRTNSTASVTQSNGKKRKTSTRSDKDRRRVTIMCAALVSTFVLLWLPFHVNHLAKLAGINVSIEMAYICENLPVAGSLLAYLNSALNPYLYSFLGSNFKRRWELLRKAPGMRQFMSMARRQSDTSGVKTRNNKNRNTSQSRHYWGTGSIKAPNSTVERNLSTKPIVYNTAMLQGPSEKASSEGRAPSPGASVYDTPRKEAGQAETEAQATTLLQ
uniref:Uncharacterized protein LOC100181055 n=1 Tax=Phallusia mammillata TaxID=59560 RepID=A0A6F9DHX0_9ASCI|nr:uncharacterized protein LOC100181055 [Phallusia mammillata]